MKQVLAGGFLFIGGCILYSVGILGYADVEVQAHLMQTPMYLGIAAMLCGAICCAIGLRNKE